MVFIRLLRSYKPPITALRIKAAVLVTVFTLIVFIGAGQALADEDPLFTASIDTSQCEYAYVVVSHPAEPTLFFQQYMKVWVNGIMVGTDLYHPNWWRWDTFTVAWDGSLIAGSHDVYVERYKSAGNLGVRGYATFLFEVDPCDSDGDGVPDDFDLCPNTILPDVPTNGLKGARFAADAEGNFDSGLDRFDGMYTLADTLGCSATQIIELEGLGGGHTKFGLSKSALKAFIDSLNGG